MEEFNVSTFEYRAQLFHANLRSEQLEEDSRNKQAELQNVVQELQGEVVSKDQQLVELNRKLVETSDAYLAHKEALEELRPELTSAHLKVAEQNEELVRLRSI